MYNSKKPRVSIPLPRQTPVGSPYDSMPTKYLNKVNIDTLYKELASSLDELLITNNPQAYYKTKQDE